MYVNVNDVRMSGNLTKDASVKPLGDSNVFNFTVAYNSGYYDKKTGQWKDNVDFFLCELWHKNREKYEKKLRKGNMVLLQGKLLQNSWQDGPDKKSIVKIRVFPNQLFVLKESGVTADDQYGTQESTEFEEDIPF